MDASEPRSEAAATSGVWMRCHGDAYVGLKLRAIITIGQPLRAPSARASIGKSVRDPSARASIGKSVRDPSARDSIGQSVRSPSARQSVNRRPVR